MYRYALAGLLALALMEMGAACPPAQRRVTIVDGSEVVEWFCPPGKVMYLSDSMYRCFNTCSSCPNGFCIEDKCQCFSDNLEPNGACKQICPNCNNGWCSSVTKCECNDGYISVKGQCLAPEEATRFNERVQSSLDSETISSTATELMLSTVLALSTIIMFRLECG